MKRLLCLLIALFMFAGTARAERVIDLPEDGGKYYTTVFTNADTPVAGWFDSDSRLKELKAQSQFSVMKSTDPQFTARHAAAVKEFPCVAITKADGTVVFKASGKNLPNNANDLVAMIRASVAVTVKPSVAPPLEVAAICNPTRMCNNPNCPNCRPKTPVAPPAVTPPAVVDTVPDIFKGKDEPEKEFPMWMAICVGLAGVGFGIGPEIVKKYKSLQLKTS